MWNYGYNQDLHKWISITYPDLLPKLYELAQNKEFWKSRLEKETKDKMKATEEHTATKLLKDQEKEKKLREMNQRLDGVEFEFEVKKLRQFTVESLKDRLRKHALKLSGRKTHLIERLEGHFHPWMPETCTCVYLPFCIRKPDEYLNRAAVIVWDTETDLSGCFMELAFSDIVSGRSFSYLKSVSDQQPQEKTCHKLTYGDVEGAPSFPEVWNLIVNFFCSLEVKTILLISHSGFDESFKKQFRISQKS